MSDFPFCKLVRSKANLGFAEGNNVAMSYARGEWLVLLNPDTEADPHCLAELADEIESSGAGRVACKLVTGTDGRTLNSGGIVLLRSGWACDDGFREADDGRFETSRDVFGGCGAAAAVPNRPGPLFPADYFAYYEDTAVAWRERQSGGRTRLAARAVVRHDVGALGRGTLAAVYVPDGTEPRSDDGHARGPVPRRVRDGEVCREIPVRHRPLARAARPRPIPGPRFVRGDPAAHPGPALRRPLRLRGRAAMRVILNGMATIEQKTGVGHYIDRLHRETLVALGPDDVRLFPGAAMRPVAARLAPRSRSLAGPAEGAGGWRGALAKVVRHSGRAAAQAYFTAYTTGLRFDLYHEPNYLPFRTALPTVVTAHDLSVVLHPEWHPAERVARHRAEFGPAMEKAAHVITGSNQVRRELLNAFPVPAERVTAVYYGIGDEFRFLPAEVVRSVRERLKLPERFLLYVGAVEPRKNLLVALKAFVDLPTAVRARCPLVLAGPWAWKAADVLAYFTDVAAPAGVRHLGYVSDADRVALYNAASALIYPSRYEGFGLPPVEMLACGGGVIAATAAAVKEVLGRHARFIDPDDVVGWRDAMAAVAADDEALAESRRGGVAHAKQFTWGRVARETLAIYRTVLGRPHIVPESHRAAA